MLLVRVVNTAQVSEVDFLVDTDELDASQHTALPVSEPLSVSHCTVKERVRLSLRTPECFSCVS